jgi:hypothetical protein
MENLSIMKNTILIFFTMFLVLLGNYKSYGQENQKVTYRGNVFELWSAVPDTIYIENIETRERERKISISDSMPIKMNGEKIFAGKELQSPALPQRSMDEYFIDLILKNKELFGQLTDGRYKINPRHFVVNEEGKILYYKFEGIDLRMRQNSPDIITKNDVVKTKINKLVNDYIESGTIKFEAAEINNKKVLGLAIGAYVRFTVKDNQVSVDL